MATVARLLPHALLGTPSPSLKWPRRRLVIVADESVAANELQTLFPGVKEYVLVRTEAGQNSQESEGPGAAARPPVVTLQWSPHIETGFTARDRRLLASAGSTAVVLKRHADSSGRMLRDLYRAGLRRVVFDESGQWRRLSIAQALIGKLRIHTEEQDLRAERPPALNTLAGALDRSVLSVLRRIATDGLGRESDYTSRQVITSFDHAVSAVSRRSGRPQIKRVMHFVSSLDSGGAERQVVNLAVSQRSGGLNTLVRTQSPLHGERAHYTPYLAENNVDARQAGALDRAAFDALVGRLNRRRSLAAILRLVPAPMRAGVLDIFGELESHQPDVLHCWLDEPNVLGGLAGLIAGVDRIVLSVRNVNPTRFPHLCKSWMQPWYAYLATKRNVILTGNSLAGIRDYAQWLGIPSDRFTILRNALVEEAFVVPDAARQSALRRSLGLEPAQPLLAGVMRLSVEKRPDVFVETVRRVRLVHPNCVAVLVGVGPLHQTVEQRIRALGLGGAVRLLGQRRDVQTILAAADVVLLTSDFEGTPNCLLEALALGRAVVATDVGGTPEVVQHGHSGLLTAREDVEALAAAVSTLLRSPSLRSEYGAVGRESVRQHFSLRQVLQQTLATYLA